MTQGSELGGVRDWGLLEHEEGVTAARGWGHTHGVSGKVFL